MTVILWLLATSLFLGACALMVFLWSLRTGQYEDLDGAANRILFDRALAAKQPDTVARRLTASERIVEMAWRGHE